MKRLFLAAIMLAFPLACRAQSGPQWPPGYQPVPFGYDSGSSPNYPGWETEWESKLNVNPVLSSSTPNTVVFGSNPNHFNSTFWNAAPFDVGGILNRSTPLVGNAPNEFLTTIQATMAATPMPAAATNAATTSSSNVLHFATVPAGIVIGMSATDTDASLLYALYNVTVTAIGTNTVTLSGNASGSGVQNGDTIAFAYNYFKGPLWSSAYCEDPSAGTIAKSCNGMTNYTVTPAGYSNIFSEGLVNVVMDQGGVGSEIGIEDDIGPTNNPNGNHCDNGISTLCHTNITLNNLGTVAGSWVIDTGANSTGWTNGIGLRNVLANGIAMYIPDSTYIESSNAAGTGSVILMENDAGNNVQVGVNASSIALNASTVVAGNISASGIGAMPLYYYNGATTASPHTAFGSVSLVAGTATVTLAGNAIFSAAQYVCNANDTNSAAAVKIAATNSSSFTVAGTGTDLINFICVGR